MLGKEMVSFWVNFMTFSGYSSPEVGISGKVFCFCFKEVSMQSALRERV